MIAIGVGCRKDCPADDIVALVRDALAELARILPRETGEGNRRRGMPPLQSPSATIHAPENPRQRGGDGPLHHPSDRPPPPFHGGGCPRASSSVPTSNAAPASLFSIAEKRGEAGLAEAAACLGLPLTFLDATALRAVVDGARTRSPRIEASYGLPSIAETAALAGAGDGAVLLVARRASARATCAIAGPPQ